MFTVVRGGRLGALVGGVIAYDKKHHVEMEKREVTFSSTESNKNEPNAQVLCFVSFASLKGRRQHAINKD